MSYDNKSEENIDINIIYKSNGNNTIKIFGETFVKNNKNNCKIIYKGKEYELQEYFENKNNNDEIILTLRIFNIITNMKGMFYKCNELSSFPDQLNCSNITDINESVNDSSSSFDELKNDFFNIYGEKEDLNPISSTLSSIKKENTLSNNTGISEILPIRNKLESLININVNDMSFMFYECNSLISLPDISKWNTSNVNNMSYMFSGCNSLISLPDIPK